MLGPSLISSPCCSTAKCQLVTDTHINVLSFRSKTIPKDASPLMLQDLIEKVMILKKAVEREKKQTTTSSVLADQLR